MTEANLLFQATKEEEQQGHKWENVKVRQNTLRTTFMAKVQLWKEHGLWLSFRIRIVVIFHLQVSPKNTSILIIHTLKPNQSDWNRRHL